MRPHFSKPPLRSLDAVHLAAAQCAGADLRAVVTYDTRMADAAGLLAVPVIAT
jgi:predicted nucleic acid-binding protein